MAAMVSEKMMDPTPTSAPPISQSMDNRDPPSGLSMDSTSGSPAREESDRPAASSPSRQLDPQSQSPSRVEEYRQLFRLPPDEVLIQDFNCALQENFLLQGHMYLFVHCICFYSNLFGFETKKIIPFHEITSVRRARAVAVFPTAIEIIAGGTKYFFTSFLFRDEAFKLINEGWLQHSNGSKEITVVQEAKPDVNIQENGNLIVEEAGCSIQSVDESDIIESDNNGPILEASNRLDDHEPEMVSTSSNMEVTEEANSEAAPIIEHLPSANSSSAWEPEDIDAPGVPEGYIKVAEAKFPIRVEEFFNLFFSNDGVNFQESFHRKCGDKDFKYTSWHPHEKFGHTRDASFQHPIKLYFGARFGSCQVVQKYRVYRNSHLIVDTSQEISDVPYADYFTVEGRWDVEEEGNGCILRVYINVAFSKKTMWKGKIVQSTLEECREAYAIWIDLAHELLKRKHLEKEEENLASNSISAEQVQRENIANTQQHVMSKASDVRMSETIPDVMDINQHVNNPLQGNVGESSVGSLFRDTFAKFTSLKFQSTPSLLLVITIAVILVLMQISILVLLSRPQRIHVIPQGNCMGSMHGVSENRREALASVNKQIKYLKDEMHFVETLLERMQNEHAQLKGKLKDLELFRN